MAAKKLKLGGTGWTLKRGGTYPNAVIVFGPKSTSKISLAVALHKTRMTMISLTRAQATKLGNALWSIAHR